jgi:hypothetical protein
LRQLEFATDPIARIGTAIQRARSEQEKKMGTSGDFREYLVCPGARIDAVDIKEDVVALMFQGGFQGSRKRLANGVSSIADEDGFIAHGISMGLLHHPRRRVPLSGGGTMPRARRRGWTQCVVGAAFGMGGVHNGFLCFWRGFFYYPLRNSQETMRNDGGEILTTEYAE